MTPGNISIRANWADKWLAFTEVGEGCWLWRGYIDAGGYGRMKIARREWRAHRLSYLLHHGDLPADADICHTCDNPACVNPDHLYAGDAQTNASDAKERGRIVAHRGAACGKARLAEETIAAIRRDYATGKYRQVDLAHKYGTVQPHVSSIIRRKVWVDVD